MKRHSPNMRQHGCAPRKNTPFLHPPLYFPAARMPPAICAAPQNSRASRIQPAPAPKMRPASEMPPVPGKQKGLSP